MRVVVECKKLEHRVLTIILVKIKNATKYGFHAIAVLIYFVDL